MDNAFGLIIPGGGFSRMDLLLLADLYNVLGQYERAIETIRKGTRWLQGRADQNYWDLCEDDREYDHGDWPARSNFGEGGSVQAGNFELDPNARHRLAVARIKMGDVEEGKVSFFILSRSRMLIFSLSYMPMLFSPKKFLIIPCCLPKLQMLILNARCMQKPSLFMNYWVVIRPYVKIISSQRSLSNQLDYYRQVASIFFFKQHHA